jgi:hypothetical protein
VAIFVLVAARSPFDLPSGHFNACFDIFDDSVFWSRLIRWRFDLLTVSAISDLSDVR